MRRLGIGWRSGLALAAMMLSSPAAGATEPERVFLQQVGSHSAIVKWRGGDADRVCWSRASFFLRIAHWPLCVRAVETEGGHKEARLFPLSPDQEFHYIVGRPGRDAVIDPDQRFRTAPVRNRTPRDGNTHIWIVGDSGTATETQLKPPLGDGVSLTHPGEALAVKQGFLTYNQGKEPVDLFLLLGDNAYLDGTDAQWQGAFFDIYPEIMKGAQVVPTIGNHEMGGTLFDLGPLLGIPPGRLITFLGGTSFSSDPLSWDDGNPATVDNGPPYLDIFTLPGEGEQGGVPSGTEQYYSIAYANVHVVSLDSQLSNRDDAQRQAMADWLAADLSANDRDWTVVIFHHPPYSKGENHDSDVEDAEIDMREVFTPIFDDYGVDVVYNGHSHSYERSFYMTGHTGLSPSFDLETHVELDAEGNGASGQGTEIYRQVSAGSGYDDKVVYTVAGSSGKADELNPCVPPRTLGCTPPDWLQHPAHYFSVPLKGSVVLDASRKTLTSRFIDEHGAVIDSFTIRR
ncbi:MAG: metallophosphoesterase [Deltaproteobacteria bacterium]|nr:metallophosphoesterase [Deltaproteobacteria bacterium]